MFEPAKVFHPDLLHAHGARAGHLDALPRLLDGSESGERIRAWINARLHRHSHQLPIQDMLNPHWVATEILAPAWPHTPVGQILQENDLVGGGGWEPRIPILPASALDDELVPNENTEAARREWQRLGGTEPVRVVQLPSQGPHLAHESAWAPAMSAAFTWILHWP